MSGLQADDSLGLGSKFDGSDAQTIGGVEINNADGASCSTTCDVQTAMTRSVNTVFANMALKYGVANVRNTAWQAGVTQALRQSDCKETTQTLADYAVVGTDCTTGITDIKIADGSYGVRPMDIAQAYATIADDGTYNPAHFIRQITNADKTQVLYQSQNSASLAFDATNSTHNSQLARTVTESMLGTGITLSGNRPSAVSVGTARSGLTARTSDAWTVGYTPSLVTAVWLGSRQDNGAPIYGYSPAKHDILGKDEPAQIWQGIMNGYLSGSTVEQFSTYVPLGDSATTTENTTSVTSATSTSSPTKAKTRTPTPTSTTTTTTEITPTTTSTPTTRATPPSTPTTPSATLQESTATSSKGWWPW